MEWCWNDRDWDKEEANDLVLLSVRWFGAMYKACVLGSMDWEGRTRSETYEHVSCYVGYVVYSDCSIVTSKNEDRHADLVVHFGVWRQVFLRFKVGSCQFGNGRSDLRSPRQVIVASHVS
jgi:hypothetical protein